MKNKTLVLVSIIMLLLIIIVLNLNASFTGFIIRDNHEQVDLSISAIPHSILVFIAIENGYFLEEGLTINLHHFSTGMKALESVLIDRSDFATTADFPITLSRLSEEEIYVIATMGYGDDIKVIARTDREIDKIKDLQGKKIATSIGTGADFFMQKLFNQNNIDINTVKIINLNPPDMPLALIKGDIDAFIIWEPHIYKAKNELGKNARIFSPKGIYGETWNIVVNKRIIAENPQVIVKFLSALKKAESFYEENPSESVIIAQKYTGATPDVINEIFNNFNIGLTLNENLQNQMLETATWINNQNNDYNLQYFNGTIRSEYMELIK